MRQTDTIAAIATSLSPSGIGIVRISGEDAIHIADKIYRGKKTLTECDTHTINYGHIIDHGRIVDQVLVMVMKAPRTYTGEDTVEIDCHGGTLVMQRILGLVVEAGAELAQPGEFTKRAFLNGKMDLAQAEAVADVIDAENSYALKAGMKQLKGGLSDAVSHIRDELRYEIAYIEAALDDPEHYDLTGYPQELEGKVRTQMSRIDALLKNADSGIIMKSGIDTVIIGRPNAGKSSIYNLLTHSDKAIVTEIPGTTRDTLTEHIKLSGVSINLTDTAGLRDSEDPVEKIGVERARLAAEDADLVICVIDGAVPLTPEDIRMLESLRSSGDKVPEHLRGDYPEKETGDEEGRHRRSIVLINKSDLDTVIDEEDIRRMTAAPVITFSAQSKEGLEELADTIGAMFFRGELGDGDQVIVTSVRHKQALISAEKSLDMVLSSIEDGQPEDFFSIDLTAAYESLGTITGDQVGDEIIDEIFSRFCMGK
jgi:tRNA modification GTPase